MSSNKLKGTRIGIQEQFSKAILEKRRLLQRKMTEAREKGKFSKLSYDSLIVENQRFRVNNDGNIYRDESYVPPHTRLEHDRESATSS